MKHPVQNVHIDKNGHKRFVPNAIVQFLLNAGPFDMNQIAMMEFDREDREQFAQLIGYSISGFGELSYVSDEAYELAEHYQHNESGQPIVIIDLGTLSIDNQEG